MPILMGLFAMYPAASIGDSAAAVKVKGYLSVLEDRPIWAVRSAANKWMRGTVGGEESRRYPPSAARLRDLATDELEGLHKEMAALQKLRRARVMPPIAEIDMAARRRQVAELLGSPST